MYSVSMYINARPATGQMPTATTTPTHPSSRPRNIRMREYKLAMYFISTQGLQLGNSSLQLRHLGINILGRDTSQATFDWRRNRGIELPVFCWGVGSVFFPEFLPVVILNAIGLRPLGRISIEMWVFASRRVFGHGGMRSCIQKCVLA